MKKKLVGILILGIMITTLLPFIGASINNNIPLFISGLDTSNNNIPLFLKVLSESNSSIPLYLQSGVAFVQLHEFTLYLMKQLNKTVYINKETDITLYK